MTGQRVCVSMLDAFASFAIPDMLLERSFEGAPVDKPPAGDGYRPIQASDGWIICTIITDAQFASACEIFNIESLKADARFSNPPERTTHLSEMWDAFEAVSMRMNVADIVEAAARKGLPLGPVNSLDQFMLDPQVINNGTFVRTSDSFGSFCQLKHPADISESPNTDSGRAPTLGEHTNLVLNDLGFDETEIAELRNLNIVG